MTYDDGNPGGIERSEDDVCPPADVVDSRRGDIHNDELHARDQHGPLQSQEAKLTLQIQFAAVEIEEPFCLAFNGRISEG